MNLDDERRLLAEIEYELQRADPRLDRRLSRFAAAPARHLAGVVLLGLAAWLVMVSISPVEIGAAWIKPMLLGISVALIVSLRWVAPAQTRQHLRRRIRRRRAQPED